MDTSHIVEDLLDGLIRGSLSVHPGGKPTEEDLASEALSLAMIELMFKLEEKE